ncbi:MAG: metal ABC transporter permease [Desulfurococcales archaeon]|nr:metal ABC transporter permease [Desulfurococcales archaeon]
MPSGSSYLLIMSAATALLGSALVGSVSPALVVARSITFGITLLHSVLAGGLVGVFLTDVAHLPVPPVVTAALVSILISVLTAEAINRGLPEDSAIATSVCLSVTTTVILTYYLSFMSPLGVSKAMSYVFGTSALATAGDVARLAATAIIVIPLIHMFWGEFKYVFFDPEGAYSMGLRVRYYRYLLYSLTAATATSLAMSLGVLLTHVVLTAPGLIAVRAAVRKIHAVAYASSLLIMASGYVLALALELPPSAGVGIFASATVIYALLGVRKWSAY